jgi:exosome complex component RRP42
MRAEYDVLHSANGSARIALEDGTEALVGVKAEVEPTQAQWRPPLGESKQEERMLLDEDQADENEGKGKNSWLEMSVEIPGFRDDDSLPVFLASMLTESLLASGGLKDRLYINRRFHWKLYIDVGALLSLVESPNVVL